MVRASLVRCTCATHHCRDDPLGYTTIPRSTRQSHREDDIELSLRQLTLISNTVHPQISQPEATTGLAAGINAISSHGTQTALTTVTGSNGTSTLALQFISVLEEYQIRIKSVDQLMEAMESLPNSSESSRRSKNRELQEHISWITAAMCNLKSLSVANTGLEQQRGTFVKVLEGKLNDIQQWETSCYDVRTKERAVDSRVAKDYESSKYFNHSLATVHPMILISMFITVVLNVIHNLPERSSNFLLQMHRELLKSAINTWSPSEELAQERVAVIMRLPKSVRTVRSRFGLEPRIQIFATCPKCSTLFEPKYDETQGIDIYPVARCNQTELDGSVCGASLLKWHVSGKQTIRVPCRPYGHYSLHDFVGEMLCRPGQEDLLERRPSTVEPDILDDVFDGRVIRNFIGPDGDMCFQKNGEGSKLYLAWAISVDWYNPYHNKIAGKNVSIGVISMVCLNLPLSVRNEVSNMYLVGIIPGPQEPSLHRINNFIRPVIKEFQESWCNGIQYTQTYKHDGGRTVVSVLIPLIADIPASRKVSGTTGHGSTCFCPLCLRKRGEMDNFTMTSDRRNRKEHVRLAKIWKNAKTQRERNKLASKNGVRQSVIFDLSYWEPHFIVVDTMHNLFLGVIKHHFQEVLGIKYDKRSEGRSQNTDKGRKSGPISAKKIRKILEILKDPQGPTSGRLKKYSVSDMVDFLVCQKIPLSIKSSNGLNKDSLIQLLLTCELVKNDNAIQETAIDQSQETAIVHNTSLVDGDELAFYSLDDIDFFTSANILKSNPANPATSKGKTKSKSRIIDPEELGAMQAAIRKTSRPSWQQAPPKGFGTSKQGKIKADQWRTLLEFDIPITLVELWVDAQESGRDKKTVDRRLALVDNTMDLAIAVFWGTSRRTSATHASNYSSYLQRYLQGLLRQSPRPKIVPNHHFSLHVSEQLLLFGPVDGWWTYPFERLIGSLQKMDTSYRIGEIEVTLLRNFYASAHLQRLFKSGECPTVLSDHISILDKCLPQHAHGSYGFNISHSSMKDIAPSKHYEQLDDDIYEAVCSLGLTTGSQMTRQFLVHRSYVVHGINYTSRELERDSIVFYETSAGRSPGVIRKIFSTANGVLFAVHRYLGADCVDPFLRWPDFRAGLWSQKLDEKVQLIDPKSTYICHAARRAWRSGENYVFRPIDRNY